MGVDKRLLHRRNVQRHIFEFLRDMKRERLSLRNPQAVMQNFVLDEEFCALRDCAVVIESVVEDLQVKRQVLANIEDAVSREALVGSNTSRYP